jgi:excisionase family DNA binding protein
MVEKYTVSELAEILGVSTTAIYKKLDKKQLEAVKERVGTRELTYILLNKNDLNRLVSETNSNKEITRVGFKQYNEPMETGTNHHYNPTNQSDYIDLTKQVIQLTQNLSNQFENYSKQMVEYAEKAGQVYLLTDNLNQEKQETETYKTEYFKYKLENENLTFHNIKLKEELEGLKLRLKTLESDLSELRERNDKLTIKNQVKEIYLEEQEKSVNTPGFFEKFSFKKRK